MNLEALTTVLRAQRFLGRADGVLATALAAVPGLIDGVCLPREGPCVAHALDPLAPAAERLVTGVAAEVEDPGDLDERLAADPFVGTLRELILAGASISPAAGALAVLEAARACTDVLGTPSTRLGPALGRARDGGPAERGAFLGALGRGLQARMVAACQGASAAGWRLPAYASELLACRPAWVLGRGTLDARPELALLAGILGVAVPVPLVAAAEEAIRFVVREVVGRAAAGKPRPEDRVLLLRHLPGEAVTGGAESAARFAPCDPDLVATVLPALSTWADAKALAKAGVDKGLAEQLVRPEVGLAVASVLVDTGLELRRWDVHSSLAAALVRPEPRLSFAAQAFGPRRRVLQGLVVAAAGRPGTPDSPLLAAPIPASALVADHGAVVLAAFADPLDAVRWALALSSARGDALSVGVGAGRINGGTDGDVTRFDGPAAQGALGAMLRGRVGLTSAAAEELTNASPAPGAPAGAMTAFVDGRPLPLEMLSGQVGVFACDPVARPAPAPTTRDDEAELAPPRPIPSLMGGTTASEGAGPTLMPTFAPKGAPAHEGGDPFREGGDSPWDDTPTRIGAVSPTPGGSRSRATPVNVPKRAATPAPPPPAPPEPEAAAADFGEESFDLLAPEAEEETGRRSPPVLPLRPPVPAERTDDDETHLERTPPEPDEGGFESLFGSEDPFANAAESFAASDDLYEAEDTAARRVAEAPRIEVAEPKAPPSAREPEPSGGPAFSAPPSNDPFASTASESEVLVSFEDFDLGFLSDSAGTPGGSAPPAPSVSPPSASATVPEVAPAPPQAAPTLPDFVPTLPGFASAPPESGPPPAPAAPAATAFEMEVEEPEDDPSNLPDSARPSPREVMDGSFDFPVDQGVDEQPVLRGGADTELTDAAFIFSDERTGPGFTFDDQTNPDVGPPVGVQPAADLFTVPDELAPAPAAPEPKRQHSLPAIDFDSMFKGYSFYLEEELIVFGRPYGTRMVDRHIYDCGSNVEEGYRRFLEDKIREGFVPQTDLGGEIPPGTSLLPINVDRLNRAWSALG